MMKAIGFCGLFTLAMIGFGWVGSEVIERFNMDEDEFIGLFMFAILLVSGLWYWGAKAKKGAQNTISKVTDVVQSAKSAIRNNASEREEY
jgi:putative Mn2+ efflux pump MntP